MTEPTPSDTYGEAPNTQYRSSGLLRPVNDDSGRYVTLIDIPYELGGLKQVAIDPSKIQTAAPIVGPLFGYSERSMQMKTALALAAASSIVRRPLTVDETDAQLEWVSKRFAVSSWGPAIGMTLGALRAFQTKNTWRYPFHQPDLNELNLEEFPKRNTFIKGPQALLWRQAARTTAYMMVATFISNEVFSMLGVRAASMGASRDLRLSNWNAELKQMMDQRLKQMYRGQQPQQQGPRQQMEEAVRQQVQYPQQPDEPNGQESQPQEQPVWPARPQQQQRSWQTGVPQQPQQQRGTGWSNSDDDASPTAGNDSFLDEALYSPSNEQNSQPVTSTPWRAGPKSFGGSWGTNDTKPTKASTNSNSGYDDASPAAPEESSSGDAWERLRQQALNNSGGSNRSL